MLPRHSVTAAAVLRAERTVNRGGVRRGVRHLERVEPELASYVMERSAELYAALDRSCPSHADVKRLHDGAVLLVLASVEALRRSTR
jgi:hypothetical protein